MATQSSILCPWDSTHASLHEALGILFMGFFMGFRESHGQMSLVGYSP